MNPSTSDWLDQVVWHNPLRTWALVLLVMIIGWLASRVVRYLLTRLVPKLTAQTETLLDDKLVERLAPRVSVLVMLASARVAMTFLTLSERSHNFALGTLGVAVGVVIASMLLRTIDVVHEELMLPWAAKQTPPASPAALNFLRTTLKVMASLLVAVMLLQRAGVDVLSLITGLGIGGLAVALAAQETLGNLLGSLQLMTDRPFTVGDWVVLDGKLARVTTIGLRSTRLQLSNGIRLVMPNKKLAEQLVENHSHTEGLVRDYGIFLDLVTPIEVLESTVAALKEELPKVPGVQSAVSVQLSKFEPGQVELRFGYRVDPEQSGAVMHQVHLTTLRIMARTGCKVAVPTRKIVQG